MSSSEQQSLQEFQRGLVSKAQEILERIQSDFSSFRKRFTPINPPNEKKPTLKELVAEAEAKPKEDS